MQNLGNRRSVQKCAQNAGSNVLKQTPSIFLVLLTLKDDISKFYIEMLLYERGCIALYVDFYVEWYFKSTFCKSSLIRFLSQASTNLLF